MEKNLPAKNLSRKGNNVYNSLNLPSAIPAAEGKNLAQSRRVRRERKTKELRQGLLTLNYRVCP
jgi:hypothetical protein